MESHRQRTRSPPEELVQVCYGCRCSHIPHSLVKLKPLLGGDIFPAAPNVPLTRSTGSLAVQRTCSAATCGCLAFLLRGPRGSWREGSGKQRSSSDRFCELRDMVSSPHACETEGEDLTPLVPFRTRICVCVIVSQPSHHPTRASNNGQEILTQEEKLQLLHLRCRKSSHRRTIMVSDREKQTSVSAILNPTKIRACLPSIESRSLERFAEATTDCQFTMTAPACSSEKLPVLTAPIHQVECHFRRASAVG
jgi:hypothetical protein